ELRDEARNGCLRIRDVLVGHLEMRHGTVGVERPRVMPLDHGRAADQHVAFHAGAGALVLLRDDRIVSQRHDERTLGGLGAEWHGRAETEQRERNEHASHGTMSPYFTRTDFNSSFCFTAFTTSKPVVTCPKTVCTPSRCRCGEWQMKNWLPPVSL